jgi:hypothetical protein
MPSEHTTGQPSWEEITTPRQDATVWRYLSLASLLSILQTKTLFFSRIAKLDDPYEGAIPTALRVALGDTTEQFGDGVIRVVDRLDAHSKLACVNCWHVNDVESAAMWKLYSFDAGVAIQSSAGGLKTAFPEAPGLKMALVQYVDLDAVELPKIPFPVYLKRKSFQHENELRLVVLEVDTISHPDGVPVRTNLSKLIERIYVSPSAPAWVADVVRRELHLYDVQAEVIHSSLYSLELK